MTIPTIGFSDNTLATDDVPDLHHFAVLATDSAGDTYLSNIQTADYSVPRYPADLAATALADGNIGVTWSNSAFNESGGILKRSLDDGATWTSIASLSTDQTTFLDTTAPAGVDVLYEAEYTRTNDSGLAESGWDVMTTPVTAAAPTGLHLITLTAGQPAAIAVPATSIDVSIPLQDLNLPSGTPVSGVDIVLREGATWIDVAPAVTTGADGKATFTITVNSTVTSGDHYIWIVDRAHTSPHALLGGSVRVRIHVN